MKYLVDTIIVSLFFLVGFSCFLAGKTYQQDIEKGYYEELQALKKGKPERIILVVPTSKTTASGLEVWDTRTLLIKKHEYMGVSWDEPIKNMMIIIE